MGITLVFNNNNSSSNNNNHFMMLIDKILTVVRKITMSICFKNKIKGTIIELEDIRMLRIITEALVCHLNLLVLFILKKLLMMIKFLCYLLMLI
mmetsp:Transcript_21278/g.2863  ORF Transcript_21278/g.2863 Transcript_21278/m.2863 type:complete len:94 (+) Transcript_21278:595-876(+)